MPEIALEVTKVRVDLPDVTYRIPGKTAGIPAAHTVMPPWKRGRGSSEQSGAAYSSGNPSAEWTLISAFPDSS